MHKPFIMTALAAAALAFAPSAAMAETVQRTTGVTHGDLDLATDEGRAELDRRIERAARQVCGMSESTVGTRIRARDARECYQQARRSLDDHFAVVLRDTARGG